MNRSRAPIFQVPSDSSTPSEEPESREADGARACQLLASLEQLLHSCSAGEGVWNQVQKAGTLGSSCLSHTSALGVVMRGLGLLLPSDWECARSPEQPPAAAYPT